MEVILKSFIGMVIMAFSFQVKAEIRTACGSGYSFALDLATSRATDQLNEKRYVFRNVQPNAIPHPTASIAKDSQGYAVVVCISVNENGGR